MGRASVKGFGQVKNSGEDLFLHRFKTQIQKLTFSFSLQPYVRTEGHPLSGLRSSVRSQPQGCHSMPGPNLALGAHLSRVFNVCR